MKEDETTTVVDEPSISTGVEETQPVAEEVEQAESTESTTESTEAEPEEDTSTEEDISDWASKKGIDLSTPEGQAKALKSMRESEKSFHSKAQEASNLAKQISTTQVDPDATTADRALAIANDLNNQQIIRTWISNNNVPTSDIAAMKEYGEANPQADALLNNGLITLDQYRAMAVSLRPVDTEAIKKQGGKEALSDLANRQRATAVKGSASSAASSTTLTRANVDQWYAGLGPKGRADPANQRTLERILAS